jgi:hypothetical protein
MTNIVVPLEDVVNAVKTAKATDDGKEEMLLIEEVCKRIKMSRYGVRRRIKAGLFVATKMGTARSARVLVYWSSVQAYLKANIISPKKKGSDK